MTPETRSAAENTPDVIEIAKRISRQLCEAAPKETRRMAEDAPPRVVGHLLKCAELAEKWLAEHPADDGEAPKSGVYPLDGDRSLIVSAGMAFIRRDYYEPKPHSQEVFLRYVETEGAVRRLLSALGCSPIMSHEAPNTYKGYEIKATNFRHPTITEGQHTNGPAPIWVRLHSGEWLLTDERQEHKVRQYIDTFGDEYAVLLGGCKADGRGEGQCQ